MNLEQFTSLASRLGFFGAFALLAVALVEIALNLLGYTVLRQTYEPGRLLEIAAVFLVFVIALQLRQMREMLRTGRSAG